MRIDSYICLMASASNITLPEDAHLTLFYFKEMPFSQTIWDIIQQDAFEDSALSLDVDGEARLNGGKYHDNDVLLFKNQALSFRRHRLGLALSQAGLFVEEQWTPHVTIKGIDKEDSLTLRAVDCEVRFETIRYKEKIVYGASVGKQPISKDHPLVWR